MTMTRKQASREARRYIDRVGLDGVVRHLGLRFRQVPCSQDGMVQFLCTCGAYTDATGSGTAPTAGKARARATFSFLVDEYTR